VRAAPRPTPTPHGRGDRFPVNAMAIGLRPITTESTGKFACITRRHRAHYPGKFARHPGR
jgi:hypothetical protein